MLGVRTERHACRKSKADRCDLTHVSLSFLNVALTKSSESRSLRLQHHAEVKRWSCSFRPFLTVLTARATQPVSDKKRLPRYRVWTSVVYYSKFDRSTSGKGHPQINVKAKISTAVSAK